MGSRPGRVIDLLAALNGGYHRRACCENTKKHLDVLTLAFAPMPLAPCSTFGTRACARGATTACSRIPRRKNLPALQRSNGPQSIPRPDNTERKTLQVEPQRTPQRANHVVVILSNTTSGTLCVGCALTAGGIRSFRPAVEGCDSNRFSAFDPSVLVQKSICSDV